MMRQSQKHTGYLAFVGHRLSGLALALFLPFHFLVLGLALEHADRLDGFLKWSDQPLVKLAEWGLVGLLALHLGFGLRILIVENFAWTGQRKGLVWASLAAAFCIGLIFLARAL